MFFFIMVIVISLDVKDFVISVCEVYIVVMEKLEEFLESYV